MKTILLAVAFLFCFAGLALASPENVHYEWEYPYSVSDLAGFKIYKDGTMLIDIPDPAAQMIDHITEIDQEVNYSFTLTAYDSSGNESAASAPYIFRWDETAPPPPNWKSIVRRLIVGALKSLGLIESFEVTVN